SFVHWLPSSAGTSPFAGTDTMLPAPSHSLCWQSPGVCVPVGVPAAGSVAPKALPLHVRRWHSVSLPGHCAGELHATHAPAALQNDPPFWLQAVSTALGGCAGTPLVHTSLVH